MEFIELAAKPRTTRGNSPARALRRDGAIPAVIYGRGKETVPLTIQNYDLEQVIKATRTLQVFVNLSIEGVGTRTTMIRELQRHPVNGSFLHVDFYEIGMDQKVTVMIPVAVVGKSQGVEMGGVLQIIRHELEAYCIPSSVPEKIEIDVTPLGLGDSVHVEDIQLPGDVELIHDTNFTIVTVVSTRKEEGAEEGEGAEAEGESAESAAAE